MILILGGTAEARELALLLVGRGTPVLSSLAGRVSRPTLPAGGVRVGGFGGPAGLAAFLAEHRIGAVVDATHPFAATISANAAEAVRRTGCPLVRLERPSWREHPRAGTWAWAPDADAARVAAEPARRPFLTTGRQSLDAFGTWTDRDVLARVVDLPELPLPERWTVVRSRGPYPYAAERSLMAVHAVDTLVTKDSGGAHVSAKLDVAADLGLRVVVIARPDPVEGVPTVASCAGVVAWLETLGW